MLAAVGVGDKAPAWSGVDLAGGTQVEFPAILGDKPAVFIFLATWCPYCKAFMLYVKEIQADYAKYGIQIISFNALERGIGDLKTHVKTLGFPLVVIADMNSIAKQYDVHYVPGLMVVNGDGVIAYRRKSTDLPAGKTVSQQWAGEVRKVLDSLIAQ